MNRLDNQGNGKNVLPTADGLKCMLWGIAKMEAELRDEAFVASDSLIDVLTMVEEQKNTFNTLVAISAA